MVSWYEQSCMARIQYLTCLRDCTNINWHFVIYFSFITFLSKLANIIAYFCMLWQYYFYSSLCDILIFFFQFFLLPIIAHYCPLWLKKHFLLQLANIIAYYCVLYNTIFTLLYSGIFYILNFYYCPLLPTLAKKALLPSPGFPGFSRDGKTRAG